LIDIDSFGERNQLSPIQPKKFDFKEETKANDKVDVSKVMA